MENPWNIWKNMGKSMENMEKNMKTYGELWENPWKIWKHLKKKGNISMGDLQDPKMEILYHFSGHFLWGYSLT